VLLTQDDGWHLLVVFWVSSIGNRTISYVKRRPANFTLYGIIKCFTDGVQWREIGKSAIEPLWRSGGVVPPYARAPI
jgi:hypothetical protein